jgi:glycosyltransferase involved in cell wall biosynthesis
MSVNKVRVGTLTANYNNGKFFGECLDGILSQTYKPEIAVVVDDGSTDDSVSQMIVAIKTHELQTLGFLTAVNMYMIKGVKVVILPQKANGGPAKARNIGFEFLKQHGMQAICVADSDDVLYPTKIEKSIAVMMKYPQVGLVYSDYDTYDMRTGETKREFKEPFSYARLFNECIVSNNSVFAANIIDMVGKYDESLFGPEDYDLWLRIAESSAVYHIPEALYKYRLSGNNITLTTPSSKFAQHVQRVHQKAMERQRGNIA